MTGVLHGLKVLDLSWGIAGPMTGMLLADHGAAVTRIERPEGAAEIDALSVADERVGIPESLAHAEEFQILIRAIESLPERCRQVVTLRKIYGLSQKEVAERLGVSEHTVEAQVGVGVRRCAEYLARFGLP